MSIEDEFHRVCDKAKKLKYPDDWLLVSAFIADRIAGGKLAIVGGLVVGVYTRGQYITGDVDASSPVADDVKQKLLKLGFEREGRHLIYPELNYLLEIPSSWIGRQKVVPVEIGGYKVDLLSPEDIIVDRLCAYKFWKSQTDFSQAAMVLAAQRERIDEKYLQARAREEEVEDAYKKLKSKLEKAGAL